MQIQYYKRLNVDADQQVASATGRLSAHSKKEIATSMLNTRWNLFKGMRWLQQTLIMQREVVTSQSTSFDA